MRFPNYGRRQPVFMLYVCTGHTNVFYVGDRVKQPGQLNGKSANLNHVMLQKIFPGVRKFDEIPPKDIIMVIDCDHMVKPEIFNKMGPCMLDEKVAVTLVPQVRLCLLFGRSCTTLLSVLYL